MADIVLASSLRALIASRTHEKPKLEVGVGLPTLDAATTKFRAGELVIITGPKKNGKTSLCQTFTTNILKEGNKILWFTYEVGYEDFFSRFPGELDFYVPDSLESGNLKWVLDHIDKGIAEKGTQVVFIDHLDFLFDDDPVTKANVRVNEASYIASIIKKLKRFAVERNILIFLMVHLVKQRWSMEDLPTSDDIRGTGQIAQLADYTMIIVRKPTDGGREYYEPDKALLYVTDNRRTGRTPRMELVMRDHFFVEETVDHWFEEEAEKKKRRPRSSL